MPRTALALAALPLALALACSTEPAAPGRPYGQAVHVNQVGYYPAAPKYCIVPDSEATSFEILDASGAVAFAGPLEPRGRWALSNEAVRQGDFSSLERPGSYVAYVEGYGRTAPFEIKEGAYAELFRGIMKSYYYQRCSMPLEAAYAGAWARAAGHPQDAAASYDPATTGHGADERIDVSGGWYDAGDYGKYVVNGGISLITLMALAELHPGLVGPGLSLGIPPSGAAGDYLAELRYELDWFLKMQDGDGGVFFKVAGRDWPGMVLPEADRQERYVIGKSASSTLTFAAALAQASRVYRPSDPSFADACLAAARRAWAWAEANPKAAHPSGGLASSGSGPYGDGSLGPCFLEAAAELYIATGEAAFGDYAKAHLGSSFPGVPWWQDLSGCAWYALATLPSGLDPAAREAIKGSILAAADLSLAVVATGCPYRVPMNASYLWGSNGAMANYGVLFAYAYRLSGDAKYLRAAAETADYLLGKNAVDYSFVTGFGSRRAMHPHHRPSEGDAILDPVPGLVPGGANQNREDRQAYPAAAPAKCFVDSNPSYSSNEPALNQEAPAAFLFGFLEANQKGL
jgi:endoglucanase